MVVALFVFLSKENIKFRKMRLDFGLDLVVLIFEKKSLGVFVSSHLSHFIIEMSYRKLEISFVLKMNKIVCVFV